MLLFEFSGLLSEDPKQYRQQLYSLRSDVLILPCHGPAEGQKVIILQNKNQDLSVPDTIRTIQQLLISAAKEGAR